MYNRTNRTTKNSLHVSGQRQRRHTQHTHTHTRTHLHPYISACTILPCMYKDLHQQDHTTKLHTHTHIHMHITLHAHLLTACTWWQILTGCLIFIGHFPQKSPRISGSFAKIDFQLEASYASSPPYMNIQCNLTTEKSPRIRGLFAKNDLQRKASSPPYINIQCNLTAQKSPRISGSCAKRDLHLKASQPVCVMSCDRGSAATRTHTHISTSIYPHTHVCSCT